MPRSLTIMLALPRYRGANHGVFLGVASLAATLRAAGFSVAILDEDVAARAEAAEGAASAATVDRVVRAIDPGLIGVHLNTPNYASGLRLISTLRACSDAPIVVGGPHATVAASSILQRHPEVTFVLRGEADHTLVQLAHTVEKGTTLDGLPGLSRRKGAAVMHYPPAPLLRLEALPLPAREALFSTTDSLLRRYARETYSTSFYSVLPGFAGRVVTSAYTSRGCDARCGFCFPSSYWSDPVSGRPRRRLRPIGALRQDLEAVRNLGFDAVFFDEPAFPFGAPPSWLREFLLLTRELDLLWGAPARLEEIDLRIVPELAAGGLRYVYYGLETPHAHLRAALGKRLDDSRSSATQTVLEANGIQCDASLLFGAPGETDETLDATIEWVDRQFPRGNAFFSVAAIWPGTPWAGELDLGPECWEPDFDRAGAERRGAVWYPEEATSIEKFYSNSTGTYHPAFMTVERALAVKERILKSGFRERFGRLARTGPAVTQ